MYCLSIGNKNFESIISEIRDFDMAEIRLDLCELSMEQVRSLFGMHKNLIATFKKTEKYTDKFRKKVLKTAILAGAAWIDLDFEHDQELLKKEFIGFIKKHNTKLIISFHDFDKTPDNECIYKKIEEIEKLKPDIIKLAFFANNEKDNERVLDLYNKYKGLLAFNMGEIGKITRVRSLLLGAPFAYVRSEESETAPGQMTKNEMMQYPQ